MMRVLVAEDDFVIMTLVVGLLTREGFEVVEAPNGEVALGLLDQYEHLDLVVTDNMMPFVDGLTLCREIRSHDKHHDVPILMISAGRRPARGEGGFDAYLSKPFAMPQFLDTVARLTRPARDRV